MDAGDWIAPVSGLVIQTIGLAVTGTWLVGRSINKLESGVRDAIASGRKEIDHSIALVENDLRDKIVGAENDGRQALASAIRLISDDVGSIRERLHNHELETERNYVRRDSFHS